MTGNPRIVQFTVTKRNEGKPQKEGCKKNQERGGRPSELLGREGRGGRAGPKRDSSHKTSKKRFNQESAVVGHDKEMGGFPTKEVAKRGS